MKIVLSQYLVLVVRTSYWHRVTECKSPTILAYDRDLCHQKIYKRRKKYYSYRNCITVMI